MDKQGNQLDKIKRGSITSRTSYL